MLGGEDVPGQEHALTSAIEDLKAEINKVATALNPEDQSLRLANVLNELKTEITALKDAINREENAEGDEALKTLVRKLFGREPVG